MKDIPILAIGAAMGLAALFAYVTGAALRLEDAWVLLPDLWDNALVALVLAIPLIPISARFGKIIPLIVLALILVMALDFMGKWNVPNAWLAAANVATAIWAAIYVLSRWLYGSKTPTSVPPPAASYSGPPRGH